MKKMLVICSFFGDASVTLEKLQRTSPGADTFYSYIGYDDSLTEEQALALIPTEAGAVPVGAEDTFLERFEAQKTAELWAAANEYQQSRMDANAMAALRSKTTPKALAVIAWVESIWTEYYTRKTVIAGGDFTGTASFRTLGEPPYDFYEAYSETTEA
jgi:hypothetical protein